MSNTSEYVPPKVWTWDTESGGRFANINRPIAGATHEKELPVGKHPLQLYSLGTPNGIKVTILLEELLALLGTYQEWPGTLQLHIKTLSNSSLLLKFAHLNIHFEYKHFIYQTHQ